MNMNWFDILKAARPTLDELTDQPESIQNLLSQPLPFDLGNVWEKQVRVFTHPSPSITGQTFSPWDALQHPQTGRGCATIINIESGNAQEWTPLMPRSELPESIANVNNLRSFTLNRHEVGVVVINLSKDRGAKSNRQIIDIMVPEDSSYITEQNPQLLTNGEAAILFIHKPVRNGGVPPRYRRQVYTQLGLGELNNRNEYIISLDEKEMMAITPQHPWPSQRNYPNITAKGRKFAPQMSKEDFEGKFRQVVLNTPNEPFTWASGD